MKTHYFASLLGLSFACAAPSVAAPSDPVAPMPARLPLACTVDGGVLFSMTNMPNAQIVGNGTTTTTTLYEGGAWTVTERGARTSTRSGCLDTRVVDRLRTELRRAPWQVTHATLTCEAIGATVIDYAVFGKPVFTEAICSGNSLDANSRVALNDAIKALNAVTVAPPRMKAACGSLVPLFRIDHRSDVVGLRTWSVEVSVDGTVTFDATEADGRHEHRTVCLFDDQLAQLRADLAQQTWKLHRVKFACAAFSPEHDVFSVNGKAVYDERMCDPDTLDTAEAARVTAIRALVDQVITQP